MPLPTSTARLDFGVWQEHDQQRAAELWGDAGVSRYISAGGFTEQDIAARLQRELANLQTHGVQYWPIFLRETGQFAGCCGLKPGPETGVYELGFQLLPDFWGRGLAREAARACVDFAFGPLGARALVAGHHPENRASQRVLESLGFRYTRDQHYPPTGLMHREYRLDPPAPEAP